MDRNFEYNQLLNKIIELSNSLILSGGLFLESSEPSPEFYLLLELRDQALEISKGNRHIVDAPENIELMKRFRETDEVFGEFLQKNYQELNDRTSKIRGYHHLKNSYDNTNSASQAFFYDNKA